MPALDTCQDCELWKSRTHVVNGHGPDDARMLFVGEAPGEHEDQQRLCFVGESGQVLRGYMRQVGIDPEAVYWLNVCRCRPLGNRTPKAEEIGACSRYLIQDIRRLTNLNIIVSLGAVALNALWGQASITRMRGHVLKQPNTGKKLLPTFHPAYIGREWSKEPDILADLAKALTESESSEMPVGATEVSFLSTVEDLRWFRNWLYEQAPTLDYLSVDVETTGLSYLEDEIMCIGFTPVRGRDFWGQGYTVPILKRGATDYWGDQTEEVLGLLQDIFGGPFRFTGQNFKFDQKFLERAHEQTSGLRDDVRTAYGFQLARQDGYIDRTALGFDTMLAFHLLHEDRPHSLSHQQSLFTTMPYYEEEIDAQSKGKQLMAYAQPGILWTYQAADTDCTGRITVVHEEALNKDPPLRWLLDNIALPLHDFTRRMELRGVLLHRERFDALCVEYKQRIAQAELDVFRHHSPFNYNSSPQVQKVLYKDLGLPRPGIKTKAGKSCPDCKEGTCEEHDATRIEALQMIQRIAPHHKNIDILDDLITLKQLVKLKGTYLDGSGGKKRGMLGHIASDGRVHTDYRITGTVTGRLSSSPNLQNIPRDKAFRSLFIPPPGCVFLEADWNQLELRIMAYVSGDKRLLDLLESGVDIHTYVARKLWPNVDPHLSDEDWALAHVDLRVRAKGFNFGLDYGLTAFTVARRFDMTQQEAEEKIRMYLGLFPGLPRYFHECQRNIILTGGSEAVTGRRRRFYGVRTFRYTKNYKHQIGDIQRQSYNFPIQTPASDIHHLASIQLDTDPWLLEALPVPGGQHERAATVLSIHDAVGMEVLADGSDDPAVAEVARYIRESMEEIPKALFDWHLPVDVKWGPSWGEAQRALDAEGNIKDLTREAA